MMNTPLNRQLNTMTELEQMRDLARRLALTLGNVEPTGKDYSRFNRHILSILGESVDMLGITQEEADEFAEKMQASE